MKRYVLVEMVTNDWGAVDPAAYVEARDLRGFMGEIHAVEIKWSGTKDTRGGE